jgi:hypothetical protein
MSQIKQVQETLHTHETIHIKPQEKVADMSTEE